MLKFNLDKILKEHNENISELSRDTGLSRKTLTQLSNNDSKGIQLNTLQKLMEHFDLPIEDFFINIESTTSASIINFDNKKATIPIDIATTEKNLLLLQLLYDDDGDGFLHYHGFPVRLLYLNSEDDKDQIFAISFSDFIDFEDKQFLNLDDDVKIEIQNEYKIIKRALSKLKNNQLFSLFLTSLAITSSSGDDNKRTFKLGFFPVSINCFGRNELEFTSIEKKNNDYRVIVPKELSYKNDSLSKHPFKYAQNKDLTIILKAKNEESKIKYIDNFF